MPPVEVSTISQAVNPPVLMSEDITGAQAAHSDTNHAMSDLSSDLRKDQFDTTSHLEDVSTYEPETPADAPINWPAWKRNAQILMVAFHSMDTVFMAAGIIPGYEAMAEAYKVTVPQASYLTSSQV